MQRTRRNRYRLRLSTEERELLRTLPRQLRDLLGTDDPALRRLFPPAYRDDPQRQAEYEGLVSPELSRERLDALAAMERTIDATELTEEEVTAWLTAVNDLRLVLGTRLDVTEELSEEGLPEDDPRAPAFVVFVYLGWLEEDIVQALASGLPEGEEGAAEG
ncbi:MAG TPA: DUF2017 family protein [Actinomycetota bacterium]|nr:DUF2017 family protein [Actinomycetota bacterium]